MIGEEPDTPSKIRELQSKLVSQGEERWRHQMLSHGIRQFREEQVFGPLGVMRLQGLNGHRVRS